MPGSEQIVREWIGGCLALHGFREDCRACVAYRDANAALDALVAERAELEIDRNDWKRISDEAEFRAEAAEARVTELEAALGEIAQPMPETDGDWGSTYDWEKSAKARRDISRAALASEEKP
jgi:hypothetical protein